MDTVESSSFPARAPVRAATRAPRPPRRARLRLAALVIAASAALAACGGGDNCSGFIGINAPAAECEALAEKFGCTNFDVEGPTCGLFGCARCEDVDTGE